MFSVRVGRLETITDRFWASLESKSASWLSALGIQANLTVLKVSQMALALALSCSRCFAGDGLCLVASLMTIWESPRTVRLPFQPCDLRNSSPLMSVVHSAVLQVNGSLVTWPFPLATKVFVSFERMIQP